MSNHVAYYSEFDSHAAQWLRNLIDAGHITPGTVDERSIRDVQPADLLGHERVHLFAGIAGWELALRLAGWPAERSVWTGSCPCQPYSSAGKGKGDDDPRNLWPEMFRLIRESRPECVFGEQVASAIGHGWLDGICADLEREGYAVGAAVLTAAGAGAPHIRQRLYWVAHLPGDGRQRRLHREACRREAAERGEAGNLTGDDCGTLRLADADRGRLGERVQRDGGQVGGESAPQRDDADGRDTATQRLGDTGGDGLQGQHIPRLPPGATERADGTGLAGFWDAFDLLPCRDSKVRRSQPGLLPVVDGLSFRLADGTAGHGSRAKALRGIGNAIVPQVAAMFIRAFLEAAA